MKTGDIVRDTITGFEGVVIARTEWLNGCVRLLVQPKKLHEGKPIESQSFDIEQLALVSAAKPAKAQPSGGDKPNPKPLPSPKRT